jgi:putative Mn2+ efflux pump MntP
MPAAACIGFDDGRHKGGGVALQLLILGIVVGSNNFATSLALGSLGQADRRWRVLLVFAVFEFSVPLIGIALGRRISSQLAEQVDWIGPLLIAGLGLWTLLVSTQRTPDAEKLARWLSSWRGLIALSAGLSVDNLVVGFGLGLATVPVLLTATIIMLCSVAFAWTGLQLGAMGRRDFESPAEAISGLLLLVVAWMVGAGWL